MIKICIIKRDVHSCLGIKKLYTKKIFNFEITKLLVNPLWWSNTKGKRYDLIICDKAFQKNSTEWFLINTVFKPMSKKFIMWRL